ncbi:DUF5615 family PIN-like protein [Candidatus Woesearchaeota archaeon]|nr:DUF5615 family PIN-like protein [Candidatus Woesearchaeota archaeon]
MKFKLDENIPLSLGIVIKQLGYYVCDVYQQNLSGKSDDQIFQTCKKEGFILITQDSDFENTLNYPPKTHPGIVVFKLKNQGTSSMIQAFNYLTKKVNLERLNNSITIVKSKMIKIRD